MSAERTRLVVVDEGGRRWAIAMDRVAAIAADRPLQPVPLAPATVAGLCLDHGRLLTVLDLARILGGASRPPPQPGYLVVLAPPFAHLALRVPSRPTLADDGAACSLLDPEALVRTVEAELDRGGAPL